MVSVSFKAVLLTLAVALLCSSADGSQGAARALRTLVPKTISFPFPIAFGVPVVTKTVSLGHPALALTHGGAVATGVTTAPAAAAAATTAPAAATTAPATTAPAAATTAPATTAPAAPAPASLPRGAPVTGSNDINQALQCQSAFNGRGGRAGIEGTLGSVCKEGDAAFNPLGCCQATAKLLNSGNLKGCACNNLVYNQLCQEVKVGDLTCDTLRPTLVGCGLQC